MQVQLERNEGMKNEQKVKQKEGKCKKGGCLRK